MISSCYARKKKFNVVNPSSWNPLRRMKGCHRSFGYPLVLFTIRYYNQRKKKNRSTWPNLSTRGDRYVYLFRCGFFENTSTTLLTSSRKSSSDLLFVSRWWPPPPPPPPPVVVSVCRIPISLPQTSFGCPKFGVSRISGIFWVRGSWSMHRKAVMPRYPLGITSQRISFFFSSSLDTYNPIFSCRSFFEFKGTFESFKCIPQRYLRPTSSSNWLTNQYMNLFEYLIMSKKSAALVKLKGGTTAYWVTWEIPWAKKLTPSLLSS